MASPIHSRSDGVFVIAATPFTESGAIDLDSIDTLTDFYLSFGIDGLTIMGIMGEAQKLSQDESLAVMQRFLQRVDGRVPVIVFAKGAHGSLANLLSLNAQVLGMDWTVDLTQVRRQLPAAVGVQGNLDPFLLTTNPGAVRTGTGRILEEMRGWKGHIFNLGHGVTPGAKLECIEALVDTVRSFR